MGQVFELRMITDYSDQNCGILVQLSGSFHLVTTATI